MPQSSQGSVDVTHLMGLKVASGMGPHPGLAWDNSVLLSRVLTNPGCSQQEKELNRCRTLPWPLQAAFQGIASEGGTRSRTWDFFSLPGHITSHELRGKPAGRGQS